MRKIKLSIIFIIGILSFSGAKLYSGIITHDNVNMRSKPSTKNEKIEILNKGDYVFLRKVGEKEKIGKWGFNYWYHVDYFRNWIKTTGWVYGAFISTKITHNRVILRSKPSTKSKIMGKLKKETKITIIKVGDEVPESGYPYWYFVKLSSGKKGWVHSDYVQ